MNKKAVMVGGLMLTALVLTGCMGKNNPTEQEEFTVAACNDYVQLMKCVTNSTTNPEGKNAVDQLITNRKGLSEAELQQECSIALEVAIANTEAYSQLGCEVPNSAGIVVDTELQEDEAQEPLDPSVVESISGQVENPRTSSQDTSSQDSMNDNQEETTRDADVVSGIIDNITGNQQ